MTARLKNFLMGWLLVFGLKEGLVECATVWVESVVILDNPLYYTATSVYSCSGGDDGDDGGGVGRFNLVDFVNTKSRSEWLQ